jgi:CxxC motif-containing protein (DUF1111 family)
MSACRGAAGLFLVWVTIAAVGACVHPPSHPAPGVVDPGVRGGPPGAGGPLLGLTADETAFFKAGLASFVEVEAVANGLGPRFNSNSCASCHLQPGVGGSSPATNPLVEVATLDGAGNALPWFITPGGPVREARAKANPDGTPNGGVRALLVVTGRRDAPGCTLAQPDFRPAGDPVTGQGGNPNFTFRIPTPVFGAGLIEAIPDQAILGNMAAGAAARAELGISGHPNAHLSGTANTSANDGTITRFGWKAQNKSLLVFSGEAYNVEMGVTNPLFPQERDETPGCLLNPTPEDRLRFSAQPGPATLSDVEAFANFMRLLAPPAPAPETPSSARGRAAFEAVGCAACHTPALRTGPRIASGSATVPSAALSGQRVDLYSDLLLHHMGRRLADGISQGQAGPDEFRTAPLWGVGQRLFFLHDGRTTSLVEAIAAHRSHGSEANEVIARFNRLGPAEQQAVIDFLRSL